MKDTRVRRLFDTLFHDPIAIQAMRLIPDCYC
jgi:hypothetical protein